MRQAARTEAGSRFLEGLERVMSSTLKQAQVFSVRLTRLYILSRFQSCTVTGSHRRLSQPIASHRIASYRIASHRITSHHITSRASLPLTPQVSVDIRQRWTQNVQAAQLEVLARVEPSLASWVATGTTQICPGCGNLVERNSGCAHMTCVCKCQFCFECGQLWIKAGTCSCGKKAEDGTSLCRVILELRAKALMMALLGTVTSQGDVLPFAVLQSIVRAALKEEMPSTCP